MTQRLVYARERWSYNVLGCETLSQPVPDRLTVFQSLMTLTWLTLYLSHCLLTICRPSQYLTVAPLDFSGAWRVYFMLSKYYMSNVSQSPLTLIMLHSLASDTDYIIIHRSPFHTTSRRCSAPLLQIQK